MGKGGGGGGGGGVGGGLRRAKLQRIPPWFRSRLRLDVLMFKHYGMHQPPPNPPVSSLGPTSDLFDLQSLSVLDPVCQNYHCCLALYG